MKSVLLTLSLLLCMVSAAAGEGRADAIRAKLLNRSDSSVLVVAHRAEWRFAPENSLAAINRSIEMGVDVVEVDVRRTADGVLVLMHDATLDRTTTGRGNIATWSYDSLQTLFLKSGCGGKTRHKIPTLQEALLAVKGKIMINLDKADSYFAQIYPLLEQTQTTNQVIIKGAKDASEVKRLYGEYLDKVIYMPVVNLDHAGAEKMIAEFEKELNPVAYELVYACADNQVAIRVGDNLLKVGKSIWYNTLWDTLTGGLDDDLALDDPDKVYGYIIRKLNANMMQTDRSEQLLNYLRKNKFHE